MKNLINVFGIVLVCDRVCDITWGSGNRWAYSVPPMLPLGCDNPNPLTHHQTIQLQCVPRVKGEVVESKRGEGELEALQ